MAPGFQIPDSFFRQRSDFRVDNGFELFTGRRIIEDDFSKFLSIEGPVATQNRGSEDIDDFLPRLLSRANDVTSQFIGVNDRNAEPPKNGGRGAFSGGDTASESHQFHRSLMAKRRRAFKQDLS
jgi:hypothetical protein